MYVKAVHISGNKRPFMCLVILTIFVNWKVENVRGGTTKTQQKAWQVEIVFNGNKWRKLVERYKAETHRKSWVELELFDNGDGGVI